MNAVRQLRQLEQERGLCLVCHQERPDWIDPERPPHGWHTRCRNWKELGEPPFAESLEHTGDGARGHGKRRSHLTRCSRLAVIARANLIDRLYVVLNC